MIKLLADSACDLEAEEAKARGIALMPLYIRFGDEEFQDGVTLSHREFSKSSSKRTTFPRRARSANTASRKRSKNSQRTAAK